MESIFNWSEVFLESLKTFGEQIMGAIPNILGAIILILLGWGIAKLAARLISKLLKVIKFDNFIDKLNTSDFLKNSKFQISPSVIISKFVYWVVLLLFIVTATETLGWRVVADEITNLINFIPNLFIGIIIFVVGLYVANFIKSLINASFKSLNLSSGGIISEFAFYLIMIIITLTAIKQTGINTKFIDANITIIIGIIVGAFAVSFANASWAILQNILAGFYSKNNFKVGQKIKINDISGEILKIDTVHVVIKSDKQKFVIPAKNLITENIEILDEKE